MKQAWVGLGSNLGDSRQILQTALQALAEIPDTRLESVSSLYRTRPWGVTDQPDFLNAVAALQTDLSPIQLLRQLLTIERHQGRQRTGNRWGPRSLDLDLLLYDQLIQTGDELTLPHPRLHERAFVLVPLAELAPELIVPGRGRVAELEAALDASERAGVLSAGTLRYHDATKPDARAGLPD